MLVVSLLCLVFSFHVAAQPQILNKQCNVTYTGVSANGIESFLGIPFAENVDGEKRFTRPVARHWRPGTVVDATKPGPACPQQRVPVSIFPLFSNVTYKSENCLNLRVDRPAHTPADAKLPVMVWIYGGGDSIGQAYDRLYTPNGLILGAAAKKTPIIYVAMNYRLNIFGFASSEALEKEGNTNVGLLDQRLALEWVQQNIQYFGGDPNKVTIFGESDGATGVGLQITAHGGKGSVPFQQAIMQSGAPTADSYVASNFSAQSTSDVAKLLGCGHQSSAQALKCLRRVPYHKLLNITLKFEKTINEFGFEAFIASVDGDFIPDTPSQLVRQGRFHRNINTIIGWQVDDSSLFTPTNIKNEGSAKRYFHKAQPRFTSATIDHLFSLYPASDFHAAFNASAAYYRTSRIQRDFETVCPSVFFAHAASKYSNAGVFMYQLDQTPLAALLKYTGNPEYGVPHFSDIFYVFNELQGYSYPLKRSDYTIAGQMSGSWAYFANTGKTGSQKGLERNITLGRWPNAFEHSRSGKVASSVYVIGGKQSGPVRLTKSTKHDGLQDLLRKCEYMSTPQFYKLLAT